MEKIILATLGPSSLNKRVITRLSDIGVNLFRINLSHTSLEELPEVIGFIQSISETPICVDTEGAQIRTGTVEESSAQMNQHQVVQAYSDGRISQKHILNFYPNQIINKIQIGDYISIDFDSVFAQVVDKEEDLDYLSLRILNGGTIGSNKAVTVHTPINLPPLTDKDKEAIKISKAFGIKHYALSFANHKKDVDFIRGLIPKGSSVISKIECINALKNLQGIASASDAILIDRGDLSREVPLESIGLVQKAIIDLAKGINTPTYIATNLLESMIHSSAPTRAEINDIFNSLEDGADGLVLAAETAIGDNPIQSARFISRMIEFHQSNLTNKNCYPIPNPSKVLVEPHGGELNYSMIENDKINLSSFRKIIVDDNDLLDAEQIAIGTFSPLSGFMKKHDLSSVLNNNKLSNGITWSMPIILQRHFYEINQFEIGETIILSNLDGIEHSLLEIQEIYEIDLETTSEQWFGTSDTAHPGVEKFISKGNLILGGKVTLIKELNSSFKSFLFSPSECRLIFEKMQWDKIIGFHTRNAPHMAHEYIQKSALESVFADGLYISPMFGQKKSGDLLPEYVVKSYQILIEEGVYPKNKVILGGFHSYPRYCGPREALFTMICRKNMGCSHFIIGRDHSGVGSFYGKSDAKNFIELLNTDLGIEPIYFDEIVFCKKKKKFITKEEALNPENISGSDVRDFLLNRKKIPKHIMRESIQEMLFEEHKKGKEIFYS